MARKKKSGTTKSNPDVIKKAGIRFNPSTYVEIDANLTNFDNSKIIAEIDGATTEYDLGGGGGGGYIEELLWENPSPTTGFKNKGILVETEIAEQYEYFKIVYRNINNVELENEITFTWDNIYNNELVYVLASRGDWNESSLRPYVYGRLIWFDGDSGGIVAEAECYELGSNVNKNFRSVPERVYGYKQEV